jgi:polar amino acid transport system substrate-binding protein
LFDGLINALASGKGDFIAAGMSVTEERKQSVDFSVEYVKSSQYLIVNEGSPISTLEDLKGKRIGVQAGTTGDLLISDEVNGTTDDAGNHAAGSLEDSGAAVVQYKTALEAALDLKNGRIDAVVIDKHPAMAIVEANEGLITAPEALSEEEAYAIAVEKGNEELLNAINTTLERLMEEGKIAEFLIAHTGGAK